MQELESVQCAHASGSSGGQRRTHRNYNIEPEVSFVTSAGLAQAHPNYVCWLTRAGT